MTPDPTLEDATALAVELLEQAQARAKEQLQSGYQRPAREPDAVLAFTRIVRSLTQLRTAVAKLAAPKPETASKTRTQTAPPADDPARDLIRQDLARTVRKNPDKRRLERELHRALDQVLADEPDLKPLAAYDAACRAVGVTPDHAQVCDQTLGMPPRVYPPRDEIPPLDPDRFTVVPWPDRKD